jgi:hypothetical protein
MQPFAAPVCMYVRLWLNLCSHPLFLCRWRVVWAVCNHLQCPDVRMYGSGQTFARTLFSIMQVACCLGCMQPFAALVRMYVCTALVKPLISPSVLMQMACCLGRMQPFAVPGCMYVRLWSNLCSHPLLFCRVRVVWAVCMQPFAALVRMYVCMYVRLCSNLCSHPLILCRGCVWSVRPCCAYKGRKA